MNRYPLGLDKVKVVANRAMAYRAVLLGYFVPLLAEQMAAVNEADQPRSGSGGRDALRSHGR